MFIIVLPDIAEDAVWKTHAHTIVGDCDAHPTVNQVYSREGPVANRLHSPMGLCITHSQNLLIVDSLNHRIMKYDLYVGNMKRIAGKDIQGYGPDLLARPSNVIYHKTTKSYIICDTHNRRVVQCFRGSKPSSKNIVANITCFGLTVDEKGYIYVSDTDRHEVTRYQVGRQHGKVVAGGKGRGRRLNQLNNPTYICIGNDQSVYISDSHNDRVVRWDKGSKEGVVVAGGKGKGKSIDQLNHPSGILIDRWDTIYVADCKNHRVMRYAKGRAPDIIVGDRYLSGSDSDKLICPEGLAFDRDGSLYVADSNNHRIQRFRRETNSNIFSLR